MANAFFAKARKSFVNGDISWRDDTIKAVLVDAADYTIDLVNDEFLSDIAEGARVATSGAFASKTSEDGVLDADDITLSTVSGDVSELLVIYQDTGVAATSRLILAIDTATGLPVTPNGGDIVIRWPSGSNKIAKI